VVTDSSSPTPSSAVSSGFVTVSSTTSGEAPGTVACTEVLGRSTEGIVSWLSEVVATTPKTAITRVSSPTMRRFFRLIRVIRDTGSSGFGGGGLRSVRCGRRWGSVFSLPGRGASSRRPKGVSRVPQRDDFARTPAWFGSWLPASDSTLGIRFGIGRGCFPPDHPQETRRSPGGLPEFRVCRPSPGVGYRIAVPADSRPRPRSPDVGADQLCRRTW
jgi:hypothetical protein